MAWFVGEAPIDLEANVDWVFEGRSKLWRYNLHYFDYLGWPDLRDARKAALVDSWIAGNPEGHGDGWEAYTTSLRVVNWIKWFWMRPDLSRASTESLARQVAWLESNVEWHLLANHVFKNAKALVFGGAFFGGRQGDQLLAEGLDLMLGQCREQILTDGGHYERSVMYHAIVLEDLLDVVQLLRLNPSLAPMPIASELQRTASNAFHYFEDVLAADGEMPLFNDAALGVTPPAPTITSYGRQVLGMEDGADRAAQGPLRVCKADTGYFGYRNGGESLLIDCGPGGPDYQPGHTHADTLGYELCLDGRRIVVDSGTYDYENTPLRHYLRSTAAHNTVVVDGESQSEVWGAFRVARRARPLYAELSLLVDGNLTFCGAHDGYHRLSGHVVHERHITVRVGQSWDIRDCITGTGVHLVESYIHLHPECRVERVAAQEYLVLVDLKPVVRIVVASAAEVAEERGVYCPRFGQQQERTTLVLRSKMTLPDELRYIIERA